MNNSQILFLHIAKYDTLYDYMNICNSDMSDSDSEYGSEGWENATKDDEILGGGGGGETGGIVGGIGNQRISTSKRCSRVCTMIIRLLHKSTSARVYGSLVFGTYCNYICKE